MQSGKAAVILMIPHFRTCAGRRATMMSQSKVPARAIKRKRHCVKLELNSELYCMLYCVLYCALYCLAYCVAGFGESEESRLKQGTESSSLKPPSLSFLCSSGSGAFGTPASSKFVSVSTSTIGFGASSFLASFFIFFAAFFFASTVFFLASSAASFSSFAVALATSAHSARALTHSPRSSTLPQRRLSGLASGRDTRMSVRPASSTFAPARLKRPRGNSSWPSEYSSSPAENSLTYRSLYDERQSRCFARRPSMRIVGEESVVRADGIVTSGKRWVRESGCHEARALVIGFTEGPIVNWRLRRM
mmetsp:Transcript_29419/g.61597  ORF Transcript_29419/g.61597 Transcript_29419/m.61597 type:complete len:305 (-) Transcript_29419:20-934(-)